MIKFNLNEKEIKMHTDAIQIALNNAPNGKIVSWHNGDRLSSGKVRVVKTYYKNDKVFIHLPKEKIWAMNNE